MRVSLSAATGPTIAERLQRGKADTLWAMPTSSGRRLVYSTDPAEATDRRRLAMSDRRPIPTKATSGEPPARPSVSADGIVRIFRERGGRGGKTVTVVRGLPHRDAALEAHAAGLRRLCGAGGTAKDGVVEIQGDHRERVAAYLRALGHRVKLAGG
jgi:translation initiation factor 1